MSGILGSFKNLIGKTQCIENHFMDNYIYSLEKFNL